MNNPKGCWRVCVGAAIVLFCVLGLMINGFSIYLPLLMDRCGLTHTQTSLFVTVRSLVSLFCMFSMGMYHKKLGIRMGMVLTVLLGAAAMFIFAYSEGILGLCLASVVGGFASGLLGNTYASALLIRRWFRKHSGVALGISAASTGLATVVGAPLVTAMVQRTSVKTTLLMEGALFAVLAVLAFLLIRNAPPGYEEEPAVQVRKKSAFRITVPMASMVLLGAIGGPGLQFLSMHYDHSGFSAVQVTALVSLAGGTLTVSKFLFGEASDRWGVYRSNWYFFGASILACILCCLPLGYGGAVASVLLFGLGMSFCTVGLSLFAKDLAEPGEYEHTLRGYQIAYQLGVVAFGTTPGLLADWSGSYIPFYAMLACFAVAALVVIQCGYLKNKTKTRTA